MSELGKWNLIFKSALVGDMLVHWRVTSFQPFQLMLLMSSSCLRSATNLLQSSQRDLNYPPTQRLGVLKIHLFFQRFKFLIIFKTNSKSFLRLPSGTQIWQFYKIPISNRRYISKWFVNFPLSCPFSGVGKMPMFSTGFNHPPLPRLYVDSSRSVGLPEGFIRQVDFQCHEDVWRVTFKTHLRFLWKNISELEINIQTSHRPPFCATRVYA